MIFLWVQNREVDRREIMPIHFCFTHTIRSSISVERLFMILSDQGVVKVVDAHASVDHKSLCVDAG